MNKFDISFCSKMFNHGWSIKQKTNKNIVFQKTKPTEINYCSFDIDENVIDELSFSNKVTYTTKTNDKELLLNQLKKEIHESATIVFETNKKINELRSKNPVYPIQCLSGKIGSARKKIKKLKKIIEVVNELQH